MVVVKYAEHMLLAGHEVPVQVLIDSGIDFSSMDKFNETYKGDDYVAYDVDEGGEDEDV